MAAELPWPRNARWPDTSSGGRHGDIADYVAGGDQHLDGLHARHQDVGARHLLPFPPDRAGHGVAHGMVVLDVRARNLGRTRARWLACQPRTG
jgi:hypothetical protein